VLPVVTADADDIALVELFADTLGDCESLKVALDDAEFEPEAPPDALGEGVPESVFESDRVDVAESVSESLVDGTAVPETDTDGEPE